MISVSFDRSGLFLSDLVIGTDPFTGSHYIPEDGVTRPDWAMRRTYAPDSIYQAGRSLLAAVREAAALPLVVYAHASTTALLRAAEDELEAAVAQWAYDLTLTIDGQSWTWPADPELPSWGAVDSGMVAAHMSRATIVIPINPPGSP